MCVTARDVGDGEVSFSVTLSDLDGTPVACKSVLDGAAGAAHRLDREAANLASMHHAGVVRPVAWDGEVLTTEFAGQPVRQIVTVPTALAASVVVSLAHTIADLHDAGLAHGAVDPSHVLIGHGSDPRLCSLGSMALATPSLEAADVAGIGTVLRHLVGDVGDGDPIPEHRSPFRRGRNRGRQYERRGLLTIADQATADVIGHRPSARRLADLVAQAVPAATVVRSDAGRISVPAHLATLIDPAPVEPPEHTPSSSTDLPFPHPALGGLVIPDTIAELFDDHGSAEAPPWPPPSAAPLGPSVPSDSDAAAAAEPEWPGEPIVATHTDDAPAPPPVTRRRTAAALTAAILGVVLLGAGVLGLVRQPDERVATAAPAPDAAPAPAAPATTGPPTEPPTTTVVPVPTSPPTTTCGPAGSPDLDGDGCADDLAVEGSIIRVGDVRFQAGEVDDVVTVGDWDCDGVVTPAVLRPTTGDVFVFVEWTESQVAVRPVERVQSATRIYPDEDALGCHQLVVEDDAGHRTAIDAR